MVYPTLQYVAGITIPISLKAREQQKKINKAWSGSRNLGDKGRIRHLLIFGYASVINH